jgi:hypothetical protein
MRRRAARSGAVRRRWAVKASSRDTAAPRRAGVPGGAADPDARFAVMSGEDSGEGAIGDDQLDPRPGQVSEIRVLHRAGGSAVLDDLGTDRASDS